ncbi:MAG: hypothetical protein IKK46_02060 [Clostridia bacterium]|nr:hypothetical protein [Clostridia bacterium]
MKQLTCEMCGGTDLMKQDDFFVCQDCGCKYSTEAAQKLMIEVDNSKKMANLYERARKSLEVDDLEHAAEYYKQILDEVPNDWEAYFYSYLGEMTSFTNAQAGSVAAKLGNTIPSAYDMAIKTDKTEEIPERLKTITAQTAARLVGIASSGAALLRQYEGGNSFNPVGKVNADMYQRMRDVAGNTIANCVIAFNPLETKIEEISKSDLKISEGIIKECLLTIRRTRYDIANWEFSPTIATKEKLIKPELIQEYAQKIKELDPEFTVPEPSSPSTSSGGCYVATAVYGSYDCPQVWTLRRYRDYTLAETWHGRAFIKTYYAISPTLVKWFGNTNWFKKMWKGTLDRMVTELQEKGVENTPYQDKNW